MSDGITFKGMGEGKPFINGLVKFLTGKAKVKPSQVIKGVAKASSIVGRLANAHPKYSKHAPIFQKVSSSLETIGSKVAQMGAGDVAIGINSGSGVKSFTVPSGVNIGGGKKLDILKKFASFLQGKYKVKPSGIMKFTGTALHTISDGMDMIPALNTASPAVRKWAKLLNSASAKYKEKIEDKFNRPAAPPATVAKKAPVEGMIDTETKGGAIRPGGCMKGKGAMYGGGRGRPKGSSIYGTRSEVWAGTKRKTRGGLTKGDLMKNKHGKIVSKKQHAKGQALYAKFCKGGTTSSSTFVTKPKSMKKPGPPGIIPSFVKQKPSGPPGIMPSFIKRKR